MAKDYISKKIIYFPITVDKGADLKHKQAYRIMMDEVSLGEDEVAEVAHRSISCRGGRLV